MKHSGLLVCAAFALLTAAACCNDRVAPVSEEMRSAAGRALDAFHQAAATADEDGYFALLAPEAVFLGTDATERWTVAEFRDFARPHFTGGSAWIFTPTKRQLVFSPDGRTVWFDELLSSASYGECRGTGGLRLIDGEWKITQYSLSIPIPNKLARRFVKEIRDLQSQ